MNVIQGYDFDDVLLVPKLSQVNHRGEVNLLVNFPWGTCYPIFSSPMAGISGVELVKKMCELGCMGILHRFMPIEARRLALADLKKTKHWGVAIGIRAMRQELDFAERAMNVGASFICVDIANGYIDELYSFIDLLISRYGFMRSRIISGNVVTGEGVKGLSRYCRFIRVGIGSGTQCTTRNVTGVGYPQLSALEDCSLYKDLLPAKILADGGIRNSGNAVKAFAVGADAVVLGTLLAYANEAEDKDGNVYGSASRRVKENYSSGITSIEGLESKIPLEEKRPLQEIIEEFLAGIRSACTYLNCNDITKIKDNATFVTAGRGSIKEL